MSQAAGSPCSLIAAHAKQVGDWQSAQPAVGEESLTDWLLYSLSRDLTFVHYRKFNRIEEGRTFGADWDWVFLTRTVTVAWRVQAKKLIHGYDHYPEIARTNRHGFQIEMLIESSERDNRTPMYAFYRDPAQQNDSRCGLNRGARDGVLIADAREVYDLFVAGRHKINAADLESISIPASCVLCCPAVAKVGPVGLYSTYFPKAATVAGGEAGLPLGQYQVPPPEFRITRGRDEVSIPLWFGSDLPPQYSSTGALLLFDLWDMTSPFDVDL